MGSVCDYHDLRRFMECEEGWNILEEIRTKLEGERIRRVQFINETEFISIVLHLVGGKKIRLLPPNLEPGYIRDKYEMALLHQEALEFAKERSKRPKRKKGSTLLPEEY